MKATMTQQQIQAWATLHTKADAASIAKRIEMTQRKVEDDHEIHGMLCVHRDQLAGRCSRRSVVARHGWLCEEHLAEQEQQIHVSRQVAKRGEWVTA